MKGSMKKLAVFVIVASITILIAAATALPGQHFPLPIRHSIQGEYAATGSGTCLVAPLGFDEQLIPKGGASMVMTFTMEGVFTFYRDGTGHIERPHAPVVILNSTLGVPYPSAGDSKDSSDFTYQVDQGGKITITQVPGSHNGEFTAGPMAGFKYKNDNRNWYGKISPDGKTITLNGGLPDIITSPPPSVEGLICNGSAVLIWQQD